MQDPPCEVGERIECGGFLGTVKYVGPIKGDPSLRLGVDWDIETRGKHNGVADGVQYFETRTSKSGSFVKPDKVNYGKTALASVQSRYGGLEDEKTTKINHQRMLLLQYSMNAPFLEMVGFDKVSQTQSNIRTLRIVNLRNQNVKCSGVDFGSTCPNIEELDVSKNLFQSWSDIFEICGQLSNLRWLNVSDNRLRMPDVIQQQYPSLKTLICSSMCLTMEDVQKLVVSFPNLEEFRAPFNGIEAFQGLIFPRLLLLDLEGNKLRRWSEVLTFSAAANLEHLVIEDIGLESISFEQDAETMPFRQLKKLCIVKNNINEWNSIGELNKLENLENLKFADNPITESEEDSTVRQIVIARIAKLKILNGVEIEPGERRGAELDYIKKYGLEWLTVKGTMNEQDFLKNHSRYLELIEQHGEPEKEELISRPKTIKSSLIKLTLCYEDRTIEQMLPASLTVAKLIIIAQKLFRMGKRPDLRYMSSGSEHVEFSISGNEMQELGSYSMQDGDKILFL